MSLIKTPQEIEFLQVGGHKLAAVLRAVTKAVKPGAMTGDLEQLACDLIEQAGGQPAFKGYRASKNDRPYPTALCISLNNEVVHAPALPSRPLKEGDIVSIDIGMVYQGLYTDMAVTVPCGKISREAERLLKVTKKSLDLAIKKIKPGLSLLELGRTIEDYVEAQGFAVVRELVGHGVGHAVHEEPQIPNYAVEAARNFILKTGMVIAIEPMVNAGHWQIAVARDGLTFKTADGSLSAHFEHTIAVTKTGHLVLTV